MSSKYLIDPQWACKPVEPGRATILERPLGLLARFTTLTGGRPLLMTTDLAARRLGVAHVETVGCDLAATVAPAA